MQPFAVRRGGENLAAVNARALEYAATVVERVRQYVDLGVAPRYQRAINPNEAVSLIIWNE